MTISGNTIAHEALTDQNARDYRRLMQRMLQGYEFVAAGGTGSGGVARSGDLAVGQRGAGANMSVDVSLGAALVGANSGATGYSATAGSWFGFNDATLNIPITAADATNARIDLVGIAFRDAEYAGATNDCQLTVITGTAAGVPAEPSIPATYHGWVTLARVDVAALATTVVTGNITDRRKRMTALGGVIPVGSAADLAAITSPWESMCAVDMANDIAYVYDGAAFVPWGQYGRAWSVITDTLLGGTGAIQFASIPQTFTHLSLMLSLRASGAVGSDAALIRFNADSGNNYSYELGQGFGNGPPTSNAQGNVSAGRIGSVAGSTGTASHFGSYHAWIAQYRAAIRKTVVVIGGSVDNAAGLFYSEQAITTWQNTAAITQIDIISAASWLALSRATLIGMR